jgi:hypothetical protein
MTKPEAMNLIWNLIVASVTAHEALGTNHIGDRLEDEYKAISALVEALTGEELPRKEWPSHASQNQP